MKKISILVVAMAMMVSCGYKTKTIALENEADSVNYAMGLMLMSNCQDSTEEGIKEFLDAVKAGHNGEWEDMPQTEMAGLSIGLSAQQYVSDGLAGRPDMTFNGNIFFQALVNTWNGDTTTFPASQIMPFWMKAMQSPAPQGIEYEAVVGSCPTESAEVELKNYFDSLNYVFGAVHTQQLKQQLPMMDTITKEEDRLDVLVKAINKGINTKMYSVPTYMGGRQLGLSIRKVEQDTTGLKDFGGIAVNFDIMFQAMINGLNDYEEMMSVEEAEQYLRELSLTKLFGDWKKQNEKWLADNAKKEGVQVTESGLQYKVIKEGNGEKPAAVDTVEVHYEGRLINDTVFDSSFQRGEPIKFCLAHVIPGWTEGLQLMSPGAEYELYIPHNLGYGEQGSRGTIDPYSTLIFKVNLIKVIHPKAEEPKAAEAEEPQAQIQMIQ